MQEQETPHAPMLVRHRVTSTALAGNPLADPTTRELPVVLPPGYDQSQRYPVLYGLAGFTGRGAGLLNDQGWMIGLAERLELLYAAGMKPAIVVLPDCFTRFGGSQYLNSTATGRYEDYLVEEIVPFVDDRYPTRAEPAGRGLFGISSGGYGALVLAMRHPGIFGAAACHSGDMAFELCYMPDFVRAATSISRMGGLERWWQDFDQRRKKDGIDFAALNIIAMAACYSPDPAAPLGVRLPFDLETCTLDEEVWARWLALDPVRMVDSHAAALRSLRLLFVDCGTRDEHGLHFGARRLAHRLDALGIPHEHQEFDDGHRGLAYRYDVSLPKLIAALS